METPKSSGLSYYKWNFGSVDEPGESGITYRTVKECDDREGERGNVMANWEQQHALLLAPNLKQPPPPPQPASLVHVHASHVNGLACWNLLELPRKPSLTVLVQGGCKEYPRQPLEDRCILLPLIYVSHYLRMTNQSVRPNKDNGFAVPRAVAPSIAIARDYRHPKNIQK